MRPCAGAAMMSADMEREEQRRRWEQNELSAVERMEQQEEARQEKMQVGCLWQTRAGQAQHVFVHCHHAKCKGPDDQWSISSQQQRRRPLYNSGQLKLGVGMCINLHSVHLDTALEHMFALACRGWSKFSEKQRLPGNELSSPSWPRQRQKPRNVPG